MFFYIIKLSIITGLIGFISIINDRPIYCFIFPAIAETNAKTVSTETKANQLLQTGNQQFQKSQFKAALQTYQSALELFQELNNEIGKAEALLSIGMTYRMLSQHSEATEFVDQALNIAKELNDKELIARCLTEKGVISYFISQYSNALELYQQAIQLSQEIKNPEIEGTALNYRGMIYRNQGKLDQALLSFQKALETIPEIDINPIRVYILNNIATIYEMRGDYPQSLELSQKALLINRDFENRYYESLILINLGIIYSDLGEYSQAESFYQQAIFILQDIGNQLGEERSLGNLAGVYADRGEYSQALDYYQQALDISQTIGDRFGEGSILGNMGSIYQTLGEYSQARDYYQQALEISQYIGDQSGEAYAFMNFGAVSAAVGQYTESLNYYQQALDIRQQIGDQAGVGHTLNSIGVVYYNFGQYSEAIEYYQQALEIRQTIGNKAGVAQSFNNIGLIYELQEQYNQALEYYQKALTIRQYIGDKAGEGSTLNNIAFIYNIRQQYNQAIEYYQQALAIRQEIGDRFGEATTFNNLGLAYDNLGDETQALIAYQQALAIFQEIGNPEGERSTLSSIGFVLEQQNKSELAIIFYKKSVNITEAIRQNIQRLSSSQQQSYTETVVDTYRRLADLLLQQNRVSEAQQVLDLLKVQELDDYLNNVRGNQQTSQGIELLPQEQQAYDDLISIQNQAVELGKELVELRNIKPEERSLEQQQRIIEIETTQQQVRQAFNAFINSPETQAKLQQLSQTTGGQNLTLPNLNLLQRQLRQIQPTAVLLYPLILEDRIELILVTPFSPPINRSVSLNPEEFRTAILNFRFNITNAAKPISVSQKSAQKLYNILIKPIENDLIQANAKTIIYAPDGILRYIPIAALHDGNQWLIEKFNINNITAASLTNLTTPVLNEKRVLAAAFTTGNYQFESGNRLFSFDGLTYAGIEVENIAAQIPGTTKLLDQEFNRDSTLPLLNDHSIIHFATHAAFVAGQPEYSFILLGDGDRITLREIETLNLPDVALVILSACQTAVGGQVGDGGEILGLGYQMQQAGVLATIASLWIVDDKGTQVLMNEFYDALLSEDETLIESLRQAQIQLIQNASNHSEEDLSHPYYWAAFILIGNGLFNFSN